MSRRSRPHYHSGLEWILGVAFEDTLTRPARLAQGFTSVRCCGSPRASSPHGLAAPALASHDGRDCVQLPPARGCYHLAPRRTFTSNPVPMPGTPSAPASGGFGLDKAPLTDISRCPRDRRPGAGLEPVATLPAARSEKKRRALLTKKPPYEPGHDGRAMALLLPFRPSGSVGPRPGGTHNDDRVGRKPV